MAKKSALFVMLGACFLSVSIGLLMRNLATERTAETAAQAQRLEIEEIIQENVKSEEKAEENEPNLAEEMSSENVGTATDALGLLSLPTLNKTLPVHASWSKTLLKTAPCCYFGNISDGIIIAGHNYRAHFGDLSHLTAGDRVSLTAMDGTIYEYEVAVTETLAGTDIEGMLTPDWALTLFTCTADGEARIAVRCEKLSGESAPSIIE